ncbi:hypothetical protein C8Q75DRAFT_862536 [Abortiporus biennis]|nr:hypothetical protein C8Q75DRAFT_862536 [Abortiporus biennis]
MLNDQNEQTSGDDMNDFSNSSRFSFNRQQLARPAIASLSSYAQSANDSEVSLQARNLMSEEALLLDPIQRSRHNDIKRSRLVLGPKFKSSTPAPAPGSRQRPGIVQPENTSLSDNLSHITGSNSKYDIQGGIGYARHSLVAPSDRTFNSVSGPSNMQPSTSSMDMLRTPGRSLRQRLHSEDSGIDTQEQPYMRILNNPEHTTPTASRQPIARHPQLHPLPPALHSRSVSVASSVLDRNDDDLSSIMMRGATDLRNAKVTVEDQRREIIMLQSQIETLKSEKDDAIKRISSVKDVARKTLDSSSKSLEDMRIILNSLKSQSVESFEVAARSKSILPELAEMRVTIGDTMKNAESLFNDDGQFYQTSEVKAVVDELRTECMNSQQVTDLLRDKLQNIGSELIDAKARVSELELAQSVDKETLRICSSNLTQAVQSVTELSVQCNKQRNEINDNLVAYVDLRSQLNISDDKVKHLQTALKTKETQMVSLQNADQENMKLKTLLEERDKQLVSMDALKKQLQTTMNDLHGQSNKINSLEVALQFKDEKIAIFSTQLEQKEESLSAYVREVSDLRENLATKSEEYSSLKSEYSHVSEEKTKLEARLENLEQYLEDKKNEVESGIQKLHQANVEFKVLEERFEDQSVTLRITKEANGDLQDRLIESEARFARDLAIATAKLNSDNALFKEKEVYYTTQMNTAEVTISELRQEIASLKDKHDTELESRDNGYLDKLQREVERVNHVQEQLSAVKLDLASSERRLQESNARIEDLETKLRQAQDDQKPHRQELNEMKDVLKGLKKKNEDLMDRAMCIEKRYKAGDLNEQEKVFINDLIQTSQSIHEQELVAKGNELRRRDNTIIELRSRINLLESSLSKHLKTQAQAKAQADNRSLIDPATWASSERSSSPSVRLNARNKGKEIRLEVPEHDQDQEHLLDGLSGSTFRPNIGQHLLPNETRTTPIGTSKLVPPKTPAPGSNLKGPLCLPPKTTTAARPTFASLARGCSDDIEDFEGNVSNQVTPVQATKRNRPLEAPVTPAPKTVKRLRTGTRNRPDPKNDGAEDGQQQADFTSNKTRTRRRR